MQQSNSVEVNKDGLIEISPTFHPTQNDGYALIDNVSTTKGKRLLHEMNVLFPEGSVSAILGPSGAGKSTLLNVLTNSLSSNSKAVADSEYLFHSQWSLPFQKQCNSQTSFLWYSSFARTLVICSPRRPLARILHCQVLHVPLCQDGKRQTATKRTG